MVTFARKPAVPRVDRLLSGMGVDVVALLGCDTSPFTGTWEKKLSKVVATHPPRLVDTADDRGLLHRGWPTLQSADEQRTLLSRSSMRT